MRKDGLGWLLLRREVRASVYFQEEVDDRIDSLAKLLEPVLLTSVGLLVGFVILGVFLPMYSYLGALQV